MVTMKTLPEISPSPEQLAIISYPPRGVQVIRGAAGSGKTSTALLMLSKLSSYWVNRKLRMNISGQTRVLVITFNKTLSGYISELAKGQIRSYPQLRMEISTFGRWSKGYMRDYDVLNENERAAKIKQLAGDIPLEDEFIVEEVDYLLGRFKSHDLSSYLSTVRTGRGLLPRVDRNLRERILDEVVRPYNEWKIQLGQLDWNDLALCQLKLNPTVKYDIIVVDEAQDLSANQLRVIMHFAADLSSVVFVLDTAQRIYPRGFTWTEAGINLRRNHRLLENHRNTRQICRFAEPLLHNLDVGDDGTLPDLSACRKDGICPFVLVGNYSSQVSHSVEYIRSNIDLLSDSVAFLKPRGGSWFGTLKNTLKANSLEYVELTREDVWPTGSENIALSTMHSAKGLEFDHIFIVGLNEQLTPHGGFEGDSLFDNWRRLLAMAITRARKSVTIGYKHGEASSLVSLLDASTYTRIVL